MDDFDSAWDTTGSLDSTRDTTGSLDSARDATGSLDSARDTTGSLDSARDTTGDFDGARDTTGDFTHFNPDGRARMVDVSDKPPTVRTAAAAGRVRMNPHTLRLVQTGGVSKGDVLGTAQLAGIMAAKRTADIIPLCHPLSLSAVDLNLHVNEADSAVDITATVRCTGPTGVEMEALTAVSAAALTVYDMCKAVQRDMEITGIRLLRKEGGRRGLWERTEGNRHGTNSQTDRERTAYPV